MRDVRSALVIGTACGMLGLLPRVHAGQAAPQAPSQPVFRAGIEILAVDVTALDADGRQVRDLDASELAVEVDGDSRHVVSAEYIPLVDPRRPVLTQAERQKAAAAASLVQQDPYVAVNNKGAPPGRLILLLIDQGNIQAGGGRMMMHQARRFVEQLQPEDRVGVAAVPPPGEMVAFTNDHDKVREALMRVQGRASSFRRRFNLSLTEALAIYQNSDARLAFEAFRRECGLNLSPFEMERCEREFEQEAAEIVSEMRRQAGDSIRAIRGVLESLAAFEGPKQVILISEGLILEHLSGDVDDLAAVAADARASLDVLMLDVNQLDPSIGERPTTPREDRRLQEEGLEALAGLSRGTLFQISTSPNFAFDRILRALAGYYLVGVEARPSDRDGKRHRLSVKTTRKGVTLRSRSRFLAGLSAATLAPTEAVSRTLRSPLPANDLPLRLSTWTFKEPGSTRVRVLVAIEVERLVDQPLDYMLGMAIIDREGRAQVPEVRSYKFSATDDPAVASYSTAVVVDPGRYQLRVGLADSEGRVGSVDRPVDAFHVDGSELALGDLLLGQAPASGQVAIEPAIEPRSTGAPLVALLEAYVPQGTVRDALKATLEVRREEEGAAITTVPMRVIAGSHPDITPIQAVLDTAALQAGRYLARATITVDGKARGHVVRPFRVEAGGAATSAAGGSVPMGSSVPAEFAELLVGGVPAFDRAEVLTPDVMATAFAAAESRGAPAKAAIKEARSGALGEAAMTALAGGDQMLAAFLKGLEFLSAGQADRAGVQFRTALQQAPQFGPTRVYLGATLAAGARYREAAGLLQSGAVPGAPPVLGRLAGEAWLRAGEAAQAIGPLEEAVKDPGADARTRKALALSYVLGGRASEAAPILTTYLAEQPADREALLAGIYALYARHAAAPDAATLEADRTLAKKWLDAYGPSAPLHALAAEWVQYLSR